MLKDDEAVIVKVDQFGKIRFNATLRERFNILKNGKVYMTVKNNILIITGHKDIYIYNNPVLSKCITRKVDAYHKIKIPEVYREMLNIEFPCELKLMDHILTSYAHLKVLT
jgi:bifunctional DNA-binding transcriptional regulator/antitoxin component of YhaV-PrlF toxin-antitoxin module